MSRWTKADVLRIADKGMGVNLGVVSAVRNSRFIIGVDSGKNTGIAIWDRNSCALIDVTSMLIHQAFEVVKKYSAEQVVFVRVEDARQRKQFGNTGREVLQGAGSVKRDATIWEDFLTDYGIPFEMVAPKNNKTKVSADYFLRLTGWQKRTDKHGRDAAMLCYMY